MNRDVKKIFIVLACYALSGGIIYNFQELWMAENNLSTQTIGIVYVRYYLFLQYFYALT